MEKRITKKYIKYFEDDQKQYGTEVALYNVYWELAAEILRSIGVTGIETKGADSGRS